MTSDATPDTAVDPRALAKQIKEYLEGGWEMPWDARMLLWHAARALGEGSLRSQASGTPAEAIAEALRDVTLNLGPNVLEAIYGGQNHLILSGAERHAIALTALKALGLEES